MLKFCSITLANNLQAVVLFDNDYFFYSQCLSMDIVITSGNQRVKGYSVFRGCLFIDCKRHDSPIFSALYFRLKGPGLSPGRGHCIVFLGKTLYSHNASLHPGV